MARQVAIVMDCGSTNATVIAVDPEGRIVASASRPSSSTPQPGCPEGWIIWDLEAVFARLCDACKEVVAQIPSDEIVAVTLDTCGADGAPVRADGSLTYPVICWQDSRTEPLAETFGDRMSPWEAFAETGYQVIPFDSLLRLIWLRENQPDALETADCFMMFAGLLSHLLCGEKSIDPTAAGTMMCMDMAKRDWSAKMLALAGLDAGFFPRWVEPGEVIGAVHAAGSAASGLPVGTPVVAAGHDTQFAAVGCGGKPGEAILSSGTWEILMLRHNRFEPTRFGFEEGLIYECDAEPGLWNPQLLMMGSGVLEWLRDLLYGDVAQRSDAYGVMIGEAQQLSPGAGGVTLVPSFVPSTGPTRKFGTRGTVLGLELDTRRGHVYRAALEGLSFQMRHALETLAEATGFQPASVRVVGGGSKNALWNQIRADVTGLPVITTEQQEATALGAAMFAFVGAGVFANAAEAQAAMDVGERTVEPGPDSPAYQDLYATYRSVPPALQGFYSG
ncbi:MAG: L-fuculokinase [Armatimonadetes bacterium]|nr:L-fuculokinase [Armatimonadota bacterium]